MSDYVMRGGQEIERLVIQAQAWEACADAILSKVGVKADSHCLDLGCGPVGILPLLAHRIGPGGRVIGVERDSNMVEGARSILRSAGREDIAVIQADVTKSGLELASFDLVHCRYLLPHVPDARAMLDEMISLTKPGGVVLVQEPDHSSWNFYPTIPAWPRLVQLGEQAFARAGVEINIGRRTFQMLREAGLEGVRVEACVLALQDAHPYMGMALTAVESLRPLMLKAGLTTETELNGLVREIEEHMARPDTWLITFTTTQAWGRRRR